MQGKTINGYTLKHLLGKGGMAEVWYAENSIEKAAAVKILREDFSHNPDIVERFRNEAKVMVKLSHANIRQVYDYGDIGGRPAIVMEYLEGDDLKARMKHGERFGEQQLEKWWNQMADALNYTHGEGVVHRDIKPSNIFIDTKGNVRLLDFGIAKVKESISSTQTGAAMGTLLYMSPEQIDDVKRVDYRTDVYSLAVTFVHLLTGKAPYDATQSSERMIMNKIVGEPVDMSGIASAWCSLLQPYLAKERDQRPALTHFSGQAEASSELDETEIDEPKQKPQPKVEPQPKPEPEPKPSPKKLTWLWVLLSIVAIGGVALGVNKAVQNKRKDELRKTIAERIKQYGPNCDLNDIDVSKVTDMSYLFYGSEFNGDISKWDVANVTYMSSMFTNSQFNGDISKWDVSNVTDMSFIFFGTPFNGDISKWNVSNVTDMRCMFYGSPFNGDISKWDVSKVTDMGGMFYNSQFNGDISKWDVSKVTDMSDMFWKSQFNGDISKWDVSNVTDMSHMFRESPFNGDISKWNVANVTDMDGMFSLSPFNGDISKWNVSKVRDMKYMFSDSPFNGDISKWDVANVTDMSQMFEYSPFNGDISKWDVSNVTNMSNMFSDSPLEGREPSWYKE